ncbi:MAG TPA: hypothetical protein VGH88_07315 [Streptosporangiaceae bacterium]
MPQESASTPTFGATGPGAAGSLAAVVAQARELDQAGHPDAPAAWERVRAAAGDGGPDDLLAAELAQAQGLARAQAGDWTAAVSGLHAAAARFEGASQPGRAAAAAARAAWAGAQPDPAADAWPELDAQLGRVRDLIAAGQAEPADLLTVRHARGAAAALAVQRDLAAAGPAGPGPGEPPGDPAGAGQPALDPELLRRLDEEARALLADARQYQSPAREAAAMSLLAFAAGVTGQRADETASLSRMADLLEEAGQPWAAAAAVTRLGELALRQGEPAPAVAWLERAVAAAAQWPPRGGPAAAAPLLLAYARAALGSSLVAAGRGREAVAVLTEAAAALGEAGAGAGAGVAARARADLGQALRQAGDPAAAAEQFELAAVGFSDGADQDALLQASVEAARARGEASMWEPARQAYEVARRLGAGRGQWAAVTRIHRELAHLSIRELGDAGLPAALVQFDEALAAAGQAAPGAGAANGRPGAAPRAAGADVTRERGITSYEAAQVLVYAGHVQDAVGWLDQALADLSADDANIETLADVACFTADIEGNRLGRAEQARERLAPVIEACARLDRAESLAALTELSAQLAS